jgi:3-oxoacyl-ACP reductase-like protein
MMSGGRSALQNELLSDIEAEFGRSFRDSSDLESVPLAILAKRFFLFQ